jgi:hypothetical protein
MRGMKKTSIIAAYFVMMAVVTLLAVFQGGCQSSTPPATTASATPSETAGTPAATDTVTIKESGTPAPTPEASAAPDKKPDVQVYSLSKGRRDPFVPFGGAAPTADNPVPTTTKNPEPQQSKGPETGTKPPIGVPAPTETAAAPVEIPVNVTGTYVSGGKNFAILTSQSGGPSFVVSTGDKVGEYKVKSISATRVILTWSGKDYIVKMKTFGPHSTKGPETKASLTEEQGKPKTLQAPAKPAAPQGGGQPQTAPPAGEKAKPEAPPGAGTEKPKGTEVK